MSPVAEHIINSLFSSPHSLKIWPTLRKSLIVAGIYFYAFNPISAQITINSISLDSICQGNEITVNFSATGIAAGNVFTAQLSDATGSFSVPIVLGTITGQDGTYNMPLTIPTGLTGGSNYMLQITSSSPPNYTSNPSNAFTIFSQLSAGSHNTESLIVCRNFDPAPLVINTPPPSGGRRPYTYEWHQGPSIVGNFSTYDPDNLIVPDSYEFYCIITDACGQSAETTHKHIQVEEDPTVTISGGGTVCQGTILTLVAIRVGGTGTYSFLWQYRASPSETWIDTGDTDNEYNPSTVNPGTLFYRVTLISNGAACNNSRDEETVTVSTNNTVTLTSAPGTDNQSVCISTPSINITYSTTGASGIGAATGLPAGVSAAWADNTITISGTPTASGTFN